jgi:hypothetical protein
MYKPRELILVALAGWILFSVTCPAFFLHAFVPERYFLRSQDQLQESSQYDSYITHAALPYMIGTCGMFLVFCAIAWKTKSMPLAIMLIASLPFLFVITIVRFFGSGGFSG